MEQEQGWIKSQGARDGRDRVEEWGGDAHAPVNGDLVRASQSSPNPCATWLKSQPAPPCLSIKSKAHQSITDPVYKHFCLRVEGPSSGESLLSLLPSAVEDVVVLATVAALVLPARGARFRAAGDVELLEAFGRGGGGGGLLRPLLCGLVWGRRGGGGASRLRGRVALALGEFSLAGDAVLADEDVACRGVVGVVSQCGVEVRRKPLVRHLEVVRTILKWTDADWASLQSAV